MSPERTELKGQDLSPEGLTKNQVSAVSYLIRSGTVNLFMHPSVETPFAICEEFQGFYLDDVGKNFSNDLREREEFDEALRWRFFMSDEWALKRIGENERKWKKNQSENLPRKIFVLIDTQIGNVEKLSQAGY